MEFAEFWPAWFIKLLRILYEQKIKIGFLTSRGLCCNFNIGILIAGVVTANSLIGKSRRSMAQNLTTSSPVNSIKDLALWLESSTDASFEEKEATSGNNLSKWNDSKKNSTNKIVISAVGDEPIYSNTINYTKT